jgi:8-oxo-dGTP pyrophosphatase MutT (NUDIX family)
MKSNKQKIIIGILGLPIRKVNGKMEFFLTRRHAPKRPDVHNRWQCSGGGLEYGENPKQCLVREFKEELNIIPKIIFPYPIVTQSLFTKYKVHCLLLCYLMDIAKQKPEIVDLETNDMGWFSLQKALKLKQMPNNPNLLKQAQKIIEENDILK